MSENRGLTPVKRSSLTDQVTENLRRAILDGTIKAGQRIIEEEIAASMQTSRGPVRDALIQLEHEGLIFRERHRGAMVVRLSAEDVEEVWNLRVALENLALRYAIDRASDTDVAALERIVEELSACLKTDFSLAKAVDLDLKFHEELLNISRQKRLIAFWQTLKPQIWFLIFSRNVFDEAGFPRDTDVWHTEMIDVIRRRDLEAGARHLKTHLESSYADLLATYRTEMKGEELNVEGDE